MRWANVIIQVAIHNTLFYNFLFIDILKDL